jgi:iron complex transport system ATP-binding protein
MPSPPILEASRVDFAYDGSGPGRGLFQGLDLAIEEGSFLGVLGPNGSGKTTLLKLFARVLEPAGGEVRLLGKPLARFSAKERAQRIALVPPEVATDVPFTVLEAVLMGRYPHQGPFTFDSEADVRIARRALEEVDALAFEKRLLFELSAGERQRVLVARALAQEPRVLLLDEPTSHLDVGHQVAAYELLRALNREAGITVVVVSHDLNLAATYCRSLVLLDRGAIVKSGAPSEVIVREILEKVYRTPIEVGRHPRGGTPWVFPREPGSG